MLHFYTTDVVVLECWIIPHRISLFIMIVAVWIVMLVTEHIMPQLSGLILIYTFLTSYTGLQTLAQWHQKRQERRKAHMPAFPRDTVKTSHLAAAFIRENNRVQDVSDYHPSVAVLVPAHNEGTVIQQTVQHLLQLTYPFLEIWIIDDRSSDNTALSLQTLASTYPNRFQWFTRGPLAKAGKSAVLNDALARTKAEVITVFDADAQVEPNFIEQLIPFLADSRVGAVQARKVMSNATQNLLTRCQHYEYAMDAHFQCGRDAVFGAVELRGNGELIKREALEAVGGWNEATVTDDLDLSTQLHLAGWDVRFAHKVTVSEEAIADFMALLRQRRRWAEGSLIRYLDYAGRLLTSPHVSLRATVDMIAWFTEFFLPFWLVCDYAVLLWAILSGEPDRIHLISSLLVLPLMSCFFTVSLLIAIQRFDRVNWLSAATWACITGTYMTVVWVPIVFWVMLRILFQRRKGLDWGKTEHFGSAVHLQESESL